MLGIVKENGNYYKEVSGIKNSKEFKEPMDLFHKVEKRSDPFTVRKMYKKKTKPIALCKKSELT